MPVQLDCVVPGACVPLGPLRHECGRPHEPLLLIYLASNARSDFALRGLEGCAVLRPSSTTEPPQNCASLVIDAGAFCCSRSTVIVLALNSMN